MPAKIARMPEMPPSLLRRVFPPRVAALRAASRRSVVIDTAAPGILVLAARGFPGAVPPSDVYEEIAVVVSRHYCLFLSLRSLSSSLHLWP